VLYKYRGANVLYVVDLCIRKRRCVYMHLPGSKLICTLPNNSYILIHSQKELYTIHVLLHGSVLQARDRNYMQ